MSGWASILIYPDEDEAALRARFIDLWARFPNYTAHQVAQHVFKDLREPALRAGKAAEVWSQDLEVLDAIEQATTRGFGVALANKEQTAAEILALARKGGASEKDRVAAYKLYTETMGYVTKTPIGEVRPGSGVDEALRQLADQLPG